ncbi:MAG: hypothetical protein ACRDSJ_02900 [Rubrobacteraceae bacterium]
MSVLERALRGMASGFLATFALSALRIGLNGLGLVYTTAPEQVVRRLETLGLIEDWSPLARRARMVVAHFGYGMAAGAAFGALRSEGEEPDSEEIEALRGNREGPGTEAAVGAAMGVLSWGTGWAGWLPLGGVHPAPWTQKTPRALLPIFDHAVYGAAWGLLYWLLARRRS